MSPNRQFYYLLVLSSSVSIKKYISRGPMYTLSCFMTCTLWTTLCGILRIVLKNGQTLKYRSGILFSILVNLQNLLWLGYLEVVFQKSYVQILVLLTDQNSYDIRLKVLVHRPSDFWDIRGLFEPPPMLLRVEGSKVKMEILIDCQV